MDFQIAIGLQLIDNFSRELLEAKESLARFSQDIEKTQKGLRNLGETLKKAFDPKVMRGQGKLWLRICGKY